MYWETARKVLAHAPAEAIKREAEPLRHVIKAIVEGDGLLGLPLRRQLRHGRKTSFDFGELCIRCGLQMQVALLDCLLRREFGNAAHGAATAAAG